MTKTNPGIPTEVTVGPYRYQVLMDAEKIKEASDDNNAPDGPGEWAAFSDHDALIIGLNPAHADDANRMSLVHELLHCSLRVSGVWPNAYAEIVAKANGQHEGFSVEEMTVSGIAGPLTAVFRDNPHVVEWLCG